MKNNPIIDICRICGDHKIMTEEHIIPKTAGGGTKVRLFNGKELIDTLGTNTDQIKGRLKQNGHTAYTLCAKCNNYSGRHYDKDFGDFIKIFTEQIPPKITIPSGINADDFLLDKRVEITALGIKPFNIAKRVLVSFCSVDFPGLTSRIPEIKKLLLDKDYSSSSQDFSIYMSLHVGNTLFFGTQAVIINMDKDPIVMQYSGIESDNIAFYMSPFNEHIKGGNLSLCLDITDWLKKYEYDEIVDIPLALTFNKSLSVQFPVPKYKTKDKKLK